MRTEKSVEYVERSVNTFDETKSDFYHGLLTRISHRFSTATANKAALTRFFSPFDLGVTGHAVVRKASNKSRHTNLLHRLATEIGEITRLSRDREGLSPCRQGCHPEWVRRISFVRKSLAEKRFFTSFRMTTLCFYRDCRLLTVVSNKDYFPVNRGVRFSRNDARPSLKSSDLMLVATCTPAACMASVRSVNMAS